MSRWMAAVKVLITAMNATQSKKDGFKQINEADRIYTPGI